ncbi:MAG: arginine--tRNA ligase [Verrucomicrobiales bacterium]|nr:arginine--tRNA ligase [Verrucomicrobiales bacterium]
MLIDTLQDRLRAAVTQVVPEAQTARVLLRPCSNPAHGDYETTSLMGIAKERKQNPRALAEAVLAQLDVSEACETVQISGAGFLNFRLRESALGRVVAEAARHEHLFFSRAAAPRSVVIDFSAPNVAKPLHVGHIRSTFLGDSLARTFRALGHRVVTDNHIGDWGTQFGMLLLGWKSSLHPDALARDPIGEMERLYKEVNARCKEDPSARDLARAELVKLQAGDAENLGIWREMQRLSQSQFDTIYQRLGVRFDHTLGESFYNPRLPGLVEELAKLGIARESEGALAIFSDGASPPKDDPFLIHRDGEWQANPFIVRKSDGGFNYASTDLATLEYRSREWSPAEVLYVTDGRQQLHFRQLFAAYRRWHPEFTARVEHVWFGSILGEDGKPFKTRSGDTVKLAELLDEAEERALALVVAKNPDLPEAEQREIARRVGLGAVKYADLLPNRQSDYVFSWDKMLALNGNTAPYLQYAYTRTRSLQRKGVELPTATEIPEVLPLPTPAEQSLARHLLNFGFTLEAVVADYRPNFLCNYLYELAGRFSQFWENCPVLKTEDPALRASRMLLGDVTGRVLQQGLDLLGIETLDRM